MMRHRKIKNVMTTDVAFVKDYTDFKDIVRLLADRQVSEVPVVDNENRVVGVVSESDLPVKQGRPERPTLFAKLTKRNKQTGTVAADLMTTSAIAIDAESTVVDGARTLVRHNIHQLPVIDETGRLVGIVGRRDLLTVFLRRDKDIRDEIVHDVFEHGLGVTVNLTTVDVSVRDDVVLLRGELETKSLVWIAESITRRVDGVVDVESRLGFALDDTHLPPADFPIVGAGRLPRKRF
ncbi:CBS domain-containing protein [Kibdelosporangium philippinense]|uniref:CBS domain-containing protein n=1 Tax=Kibdelosporangium philippinense TaxID=211113 RepID=A0ABS8Z9U6_9PSEU|nr:CBS domain-containing protein [Kibdelosporangium philippinense]MCE7004635.1 CBS domain-containing protein [Kibdelosporangium philippinense]